MILALTDSWCLFTKRQSNHNRHAFDAVTVHFRAYKGVGSLTGTCKCLVCSPKPAFRLESPKILDTISNGSGTRLGNLEFSQCGVTLFDTTGIKESEAKRVTTKRLHLPPHLWYLITMYVHIHWNWQRGYQHHFHWTRHHLHLRVTSDPFCLLSTVVLRRTRAFSFRPQPVRAVKSPGLLSRRHVSPSADKTDTSASEASFYTTRPPSGESVKLSWRVKSFTVPRPSCVEKWKSSSLAVDILTAPTLCVKYRILSDSTNNPSPFERRMWMCNLQHQTQPTVVIWGFNQTSILMILELETFIHFILSILMSMCSARIFNKAQRYMLTFRSSMGVKASLHGGLSGSAMSLSPDLCLSSSWEKKSLLLVW